MRRSFMSNGLRRIAFCGSIAAAIAVVALATAATGKQSDSARGDHGDRGGGSGHAGKAGKLGRHGSLSIEKSSFGELEDGTAIDRYTLSNRSMKVAIITYGGIIQELWAPDRRGRQANVTLGFADLEGYTTGDPGYPPGAAPNPAYFGAIIGRYGNRIAGGTFELDGDDLHARRQQRSRTASTAASSGSTSASGMPTPSVEDDSVGLTLTRTSIAGEGCTDTVPPDCTGYPGNLDVEVVYTLDKRNNLEDATTPRRPTRRRSSTSPTTPTGTWRARARGRSTTTGCTLNASGYTPVDETLIPTGEIDPVAGTPFDFTQPHAIGERIREDDEQLMFGRGYDHNWVLDRPAGDTSLIEAAQAARPIQRAHAHDLDDRTGDPVLLGQLPRRDALRHERPGLPAGRRARARDAALSRLAEPAGLPVDPARPGRDVRHDDHLLVLGVPPRPLTGCENRPERGPRARAGRLQARINSSTSSRRATMSASDTRLSRHSRSSGSVLDARTLKCQSS